MTNTMMRRCPLYFILFLLVGSDLHAQTPVNQLVAWFHFDSTFIHDGSGNGSTGTVFGQPELTCGIVPGANNLSLRMDGQDDAILFIGPVVDLFAQNDFTVSFYYKPVSTPGTQLIMAKQNFNQCSSKPAFWVRYSFNSNSISSGITDDSLSATVTGKLDEGRCWNLITLVRNVNKYSLYINGKLKNAVSTPARVNLKDANTLLRIGEPICPTDRWANGFFDELRFYKRALSESEIGFLDQKPDRLVNADTIVFLGNDVQTLPTHTCATSFEWVPSVGVSDPQSSAPIITPTETTTYRINFKDQYCVAWDTFRIKVIDPSTLDCSDIFIPSAFTPTVSSGRNDRFGISNPFAISEFISFEVFDRWGGRMFNANNSFDQWDGNFNGTPVNPGNYLYRLKYRCEGEERVKAGNVILIR